MLFSALKFAMPQGQYLPMIVKAFLDNPNRLMNIKMLTQYFDPLPSSSVHISGYL